MKFNQSFHTANLKSRFTAMNPILALLMFFSIALTTIVLLPFLLLLGLLSFITLQLLGKKILQKNQPQAQQGDVYQGSADVQREQAAPYAEMFNRSKPNQTQHTGRTFEHQAD
jgi:predicted membrane protein